MSESSSAFEEAQKFFQQGNFCSAQSSLREHIKINPQSADGHHLMALCYHETEQHEMAIEWIEKAIEQKPEEVKKELTKKITK